MGDSLLTADLPEELAGPFEGRHLAGAGADNLVLPYQGIRGDEMSSEQQQLLLDLAAVYVSRLPAQGLGKVGSCRSDEVEGPVWVAAVMS